MPISDRCIQCRAQTARRIGVKFWRTITESSVNKNGLSSTLWRVGKWEKSTLWLTWRGFWTNFWKLALAPAIYVSELSQRQVWKAAHQTYVRGERSKIKFLAFSESTLDGFLTDPGFFVRMCRRSKEVYFSRISGIEASLKLEIACPGLPFGHVTSTLEPKNRAIGDA